MSPEDPPIEYEPFSPRAALMSPEGPPIKYQPSSPGGALKTVRIGEVIAPAAPSTVEDTGLDADELANLALKVAYTQPEFTTEFTVRRLALPLPITAELLEQLRSHKLIETLGEVGVLGYRFAITQRGRDRARRLLEISGYVGAAPVSLGDYVQSLEWQLHRLPAVSTEGVSAALEELELTEEALEIVGFALSSGRSLFLHGPPGNGKTSVGHLIHNAVAGHLWIPHCIGLENNVIRLYDPQCHELAPITGLSGEQDRAIDHRWIRIRRPFVVVGGELTIEALDLGYSPSIRYYEAPLHLKANGGTFLLDDFGYQRVEPRRLLSRWIFPLEHRVDHLTLQTGQTVEVPFRQMLIVSTNIEPNKVMDPAFLRRMGYRLYLGHPKPEQYARIFTRYATRYGAEAPPKVVDRVLARYQSEARSLNCCEPRDLIERIRDVCGYQNRALVLNDQTIDWAWKGYFGDHLRK